MPLDTIQAVARGCSVSTTAKSSIELVESKNRNKRGSLSKVVISYAHNSVWFSVDRNKNWSPYLADNGGFQKKCDYVIMNKTGGKIKIIFVELKSLNVAKEESLEKFKATECFMDYCESIAKRFFNKTITGGCEKRFVVFHLGPSMAKTSTRQESLIHNKPENAKFIANPNRTKLKQLL